MKIILIRHGLTEENKKDILSSQLGGKLSEEGILQVKRLATRLRDYKIDFIYSSDLSRTKDTVLEILKYQQDAPVIYDPLLREMHKGVYDGKTSKELKTEFKKSGKQWYEFRPENGENYVDLKKRASKFFKNLVKDNDPDSTILICSHDSWLIAFMILFLKRSFEQVGKDEFDFENASITILELRDGERKVIKINDISHL